MAIVTDSKQTTNERTRERMSFRLHHISWTDDDDDDDDDAHDWETENRNRIRNQIAIHSHPHIVYTHSCGNMLYTLHSTLIAWRIQMSNSL